MLYEMDDATFNLIMSILTWAAIFIGLGCIGYVAYSGSKTGKQLATLRAGYEKAVKKERLARLRHRDFKAFCLEVNNLRAARGQKPIPADLLKKVQYNLMYSIDED
jgi:hypothetical protein